MCIIYFMYFEILFNENICDIDKNWIEIIKIIKSKIFF